jgi:glycosyltransferase involved in cell wall biosynthesis
MKVLFLVQKDQRIILDRLYEAVGEHVDCDLRRLSGDEQAHLRDYFAAIDVAAYDRILFFLRFKKEIKQVRFIRTVPNLVILEHDAYQNYVRGKYQGKFSRHYRALPWARVLSSGVMVSRRLREEGFDCVFVPKGYDETRLRNLGTPRDIELAFVGSTGSRVYQGRKTFLEELGRHEPLQVVRTASGEDYLAMLNRIRFFVSCDLGLGEYMIKNFEAMACGCVLLAYDQGEEENGALGLRDMENVVLYRDLDSLRQKLTRLRAEPALADAIAAAGQRLVEERYTFATVGRNIAEALRAPLRERRPAPALWRRLLPFMR